MDITILVKQVYWYISQVSGERLQDHWSSGFSFIREKQLSLDGERNTKYWSPDPWRHAGSSVASKDDHPKTTLAINPRLYVKHQCKQNKNIFNPYYLIYTDDVVLFYKVFLMGSIFCMGDWVGMGLNELRHEKTGFSHMRKKRRRSAVQ